MENQLQAQNHKTLRIETSTPRPVHVLTYTMRGSHGFGTPTALISKSLPTVSDPQENISQLFLKGKQQNYVRTMPETRPEVASQRMIPQAADKILLLHPSIRFYFDVLANLPLQRAIGIYTFQRFLTFSSLEKSSTSNRLNLVLSTPCLFANSSQPKEQAL